MPTVEANGKKFNFPEGTTPEQMGAAIDEFFGAQKPQRPQGTMPVVEENKHFDVNNDGFITPEEMELINSMSPMDAFLVGAGRGLTKIGRGLGIVEPESDIEKSSFEALSEARPVATTAGEIAGETAPFLLPGGAVAKIGATGGRVAGSTALGASEGLLIAKGEDRTGGEQVASAGVGGVVAGGLELAMPRISRLGGKLWRRLRGSKPTVELFDSAGNPTPEMQRVLDESGLTFDDMVDAANRGVDELAPEQVARKTFLESEGLTPTRAQVTRDAADFQAQQEAAKTSGRVRDALEEQEQILSTRFSTAVDATGGTATQEVNPIADVLTSKAQVLDDEINRLYGVARERAPTEKNIKFNFLGARLKKLMPQNTASGGRVEAIVGELQTMGVMDKDFNVIGKISVEQAEEVRKLANGLYDPQNPTGNNVLRQIKEALDDDVFQAAGQDVFSEARNAKRTFEEGLSRAKISKFDSRKQNLVRDVLENKIDPDQFVQKTVLSKKWRADDLQQLKDYISTEEAGQQAWNDLRAEVLEDIRSKAFIGPEDAQGFQALSRDKLEKAVNAIGDSKLKVLFSPDEIKFLKAMQDVAKLREPVRGTQQGMGPSAQAIGRLEKIIRSAPIINELYDMTIDASGRMAMRAKPKALARPVAGAGLLPAAGGAVAASQVGDNNDQ